MRSPTKADTKNSGPKKTKCPKIEANVENNVRVIVLEVVLFHYIGSLKEM